MSVEITRDDVIRMSYELNVIMTILKEKEIADLMTKYHINEKQLPCFYNRLLTSKRYYNSQRNSTKAILDLQSDIKVYTLGKFADGQYKKDVEVMKPEVLVSIKQIASATEYESGR